MRSLPLSLFSALALGTVIHATPVDPVNFAETTLVNDAALNLATGMAWAPDGSNRLFVTRKGGEVRIVQYGFSGGVPTGTVLPTPFATETVFTNSECGLLGICFDPDFVNNQYVYFFITVSNTQQQIVRYAASSNVGVNRTVIVLGLPTRGANHDGGAVGIGPDGKLYWAIGDNGNGTGVDADLTSLAAKVGRADRFTGQPVNDNPFFDGGGPNNDYIWARGFRNPFTFLFHPVSGKLWVNTVGTAYEQVFVPTAGSHAGYNDFENNQPAGYLTPVIVYRTNNSDTRDITASGAVRSGGITTFTTTVNHGFRRGGKITVLGVTIPSFDGSFYVASVPSPTTFTVAQTGQPNASSGNGSAVTLNIGGSLTGGHFYDSTAFPVAYHGNFFFGDYNSDRIERAVLDAQGVVSVDHFVTGNDHQVDVATGPDGALYFASVTNNKIQRLASTSSAQNLIVQPTAFQIVEGGDGIFTVRLNAAPASNVTVTIAKLSGDADVTLVSNGSLTFTPGNWNQLQTVKVHAAADGDFNNDSATFRVSSSGLTSYDVRVNVIDGNETNLVLSAVNVALTEGDNNTFTVRLDRAPSSPVTVTVARTSGSTDLNVTGGSSLVFTPDHYNVPQTVTLAAAEDADTVDESAVVSVSIPGAPAPTVNASITDNDRPEPVITTNPVVTAVVNNPYSYDVDAVGTPTPIYALTTAPAGMLINPATGVISWTPTAAGSYDVVVQAANGILPNAQQSFTITVSADAAPTALLTQPLPGEIISGSQAEFFGDGIDDVATIKGEFLVDGVLRFTDNNSGGHYHFGGSHSLFDTTPFTNGPHTLRFRVTDTASQTDFKEVQVSIGNGIAKWRSQNFTAAELNNPAISGNLADRELDGLNNLLEYSSDSDPKAANISRLPKLRMVNVGGTNYLALEFIMVKWATDLTYSVEADSDLLAPWTAIDPLSPTYQVSFLDNTPSFGLATIVVRDVVPASTNARSMRLRVSVP